jgi:hypothetical protein
MHAASASDTVFCIFEQHEHVLAGKHARLPYTLRSCLNMLCTKHISAHPPCALSATMACDGPPAAQTKCLFLQTPAHAGLLKTLASDTHWNVRAEVPDMLINLLAVTQHNQQHSNLPFSPVVPAPA